MQWDLMGMLKLVGANQNLTQKEEQDLDLEIQFMEGLVRRAPGFVEALQVLAVDYARRGDFELSLKVDEQLARLRPDDPVVLYNLACSYSLSGQLGHAADVLGQAIDRGYRDFKTIVKDPDLANLRRNALFKKLQTKMRSASLHLS
jgi:Flp pilus assembly protein TadD